MRNKKQRFVEQRENRTGLSTMRNSKKKKKNQTSNSENSTFRYRERTIGAPHGETNRPIRPVSRCEGHCVNTRVASVNTRCAKCGDSSRIHPAGGMPENVVEKHRRGTADVSRTSLAMPAWARNARRLPFARRRIEAALGFLGTPSRLESRRQNAATSLRFSASRSRSSINK